jgi:hypothetical protein
VKPLRPATVTNLPPFSTWAAAVMKATGMPVTEARRIYDEEFLAGDVFMNDQYTVIRYARGDWHHLSIRRNDRKPCRDWRDFQQIKNELCGLEREGMELYPADSRVVDTANQFHIWVLPAGHAIPCGYSQGSKVGPDEHVIPGAVQRAFEVL